MTLSGSRYPEPWGMMGLSLVLHALIASFIIWYSQGLRFQPDQEPVTYVDMVALPVASPQSGAPVAAQPAAQSAPAPVPAAPQAMTLPAKPQPKPTVPSPKAKPVPTPADDARQFSERMAKLEQQAEERRQAEVMERLRKGVKGSSGAKAGESRVGMPGAKGTEAGSDYASYIQSRLKDAFRQVAASQTKSPQVLVRITIGPDGAVTSSRIEKASGDQLFDDAVARAIALAARSFRPPPGGGSFERVFRFKPEGVLLP